MENTKKKLEEFAAECRKGNTQKWKGGGLEGANLVGADLRGVNLKGADLNGAYLRGANLTDADLTDTDLYAVNLYYANLYCANLRGADLEYATFQYANLTGADLRGASLHITSLKNSLLYGADLTGASFKNPYLDGANLRGAKGFRFESAPDAQELRIAVADQIEASPELHDQERWGSGEPNECGTPCCVAGWACRLGGGRRGLLVENAAIRLLHIDGKKMPSFNESAKREDILEALRS